MRCRWLERLWSVAFSATQGSDGALPSRPERCVSTKRCDKSSDRVENLAIDLVLRLPAGMKLALSHA